MQLRKNWKPPAAGAAAGPIPRMQLRKNWKKCPLSGGIWSIDSRCNSERIESLTLVSWWSMNTRCNSERIERASSQRARRATTTPRCRCNSERIEKRTSLSTLGGWGCPWCNSERIERHRKTTHNPHRIPIWMQLRKNWKLRLTARCKGLPYLRCNSERIERLTQQETVKVVEADQDATQKELKG